MKIVAVTACPTGIAHTYMAAELLQREAQRRGLRIQVETQGAMGVESALSASEIIHADRRLIASDIAIDAPDRFSGCDTLRVSIEQVLTNVAHVFDRLLAHR